MIDECKVIFDTPILAATVERDFLTARKRYASVWAIGQTPEQIVGTHAKPNPYDIGIAKNASTKIIGKQPGDMTTHREHMHYCSSMIRRNKMEFVPNFYALLYNSRQTTMCPKWAFDFVVSYPSAHSSGRWWQSYAASEASAFFRCNPSLPQTIIWARSWSMRGETP